MKQIFSILFSRSAIYMSNLRRRLPKHSPFAVKLLLLPAFCFASSCSPYMGSDVGRPQASEGTPISGEPQNELEIVTVDMLEDSPNQMSLPEITSYAFENTGKRGETVDIGVNIDFLGFRSFSTGRFFSSGISQCPSLFLSTFGSPCTGEFVSGRILLPYENKKRCFSYSELRLFVPGMVVVEPNTSDMREPRSRMCDSVNLECRDATAADYVYHTMSAVPQSLAEFLRLIGRPCW